MCDGLRMNQWTGAANQCATTTLPFFHRTFIIGDGCRALSEGRVIDMTFFKIYMYWMHYWLQHLLPHLPHCLLSVLLHVSE